MARPPIVGHTDDELKALEETAAALMAEALQAVMDTIAARIERNAHPHDNA